MSLYEEPANTTSGMDAEIETCYIQMDSSSTSSSTSSSSSAAAASAAEGNTTSFFDSVAAGGNKQDASSASSVSPKPPSATPAASGKKNPLIASPFGTGAKVSGARPAKAKHAPITGTKLQHQRKLIHQGPGGNKNNSKTNINSNALPAGLCEDAEPGKDRIVSRRWIFIGLWVFILLCFLGFIAGLIWAALAPPEAVNKKALSNPGVYILLSVVLIMVLSFGMSAFSITVTFDKTNKLVIVDMFYYLYPCCSKSQEFPFSDILGITGGKRVTTNERNKIAQYQVELVVKDSAAPDGKNFTRLYIGEICCGTCNCCCENVEEITEEVVLQWDSYLRNKLNLALTNTATMMSAEF